MNENFKEGLRLYKAGRFEQALYYFDEDDPVVQPLNAYHMALCHLSLEHFAEALELVNLVLEKDDNLLRLLQCQILKAYILIQLEDWMGAQSWLEKLLAEGTDSTQVRSLLGYVLLNQGRAAEGLQHLNTALGKNPNHPNVLNTMGYVLAEKGLHLTKALGLVRKAHLSNPENPAYMDSLGWVLFKLGQHEQAVTYLEKAYRLKNHPTIREHLDLARRELGKKASLR